MEAGRARHHRTPWTLLIFVLGIALLTMPSRYYIGDPHYWQKEAIRLIRSHELWFDDSPEKGNGQYAVLNPKDGHYHSKFGVMNSILSLPPLVVEKLVNGDLPFPRPPSRTLFLNLYNLLLTGLIAATLYRLARRYSEVSAHRVGYVVACLFATFLWNYLRAQSGEIYQVALFGWLFETLLRWRNRVRSDAGRWTLASAGWLGLAWSCVIALCLCRLSQVVLVPVVLLAMAVTLWRSAPARGSEQVAKLLPLVLPGLVLVGIILLVNDLRFGSPFTTGYEEWRPEIHRWNGSVTDGVIGFLFDPQRSVFLCFPPLIGAAIGFRRFIREHQFEGTFLAVTFVAFLFALGLLPSWRGEWSYGPRYLTFLLPVASLPCLSFLASLREGGFGAAGGILRAGVVLVVTVSVFLQVEVNRIWFFSYYAVRDLPTMPQLQGSVDWLIHDAPFGWINFDLASVHGNFEQLSYVRLLRERNIDPELIRGYEARLRDVALVPNYYWKVME